jgi:CHAT domain-containing protein
VTQLKILSFSNSNVLQPSAGKGRSRLWWCVTGELSFLPVHAAGKYHGDNAVCAADYVISSYIPTLSSLAKTTQGWTPISRSQLAGILVCEASSEISSTAVLPNAVDEIILVRECFRKGEAQVLNLFSAHTSISDLCSLLEGTRAHVLHLACHGVQDAEPLKSAILLQDGALTIERFMQFNFTHAVLAFLSACQTAKGARNAPDQAVHIAASMLFCGFRSVIGTMWCALKARHPGPGLLTCSQLQAHARRRRPKDCPTRLR